MNIVIERTAEQLASAAAKQAERIVNRAIARQGYARIVLSTGQSQFEFFKAFVRRDIDWSKVEAFHLDDYIRMPENHPASFKAYLQERFLRYAPVGRMHFVEGNADNVATMLERLTAEIRRLPIDLAMIGIGENTHIAFNDPPADFETDEAFHIVRLDDVCRRQQFKEGWFSSPEAVPETAISMTVREMMRSRAIISCVPYPSKAGAVKRTLEADVSPDVPASILKTHERFYLFLDRDSASQIVRL